MSEFIDKKLKEFDEKFKKYFRDLEIMYLTKDVENGLNDFIRTALEEQEKMLRLDEDILCQTLIKTIIDKYDSQIDVGSDVKELAKAIVNLQLGGGE